MIVVAQELMHHGQLVITTVNATGPTRIINPPDEAMGGPLVSGRKIHRHVRDA